MTTSMSSPHGSSGAPGTGPSPDIPEGMRTDARETWPSKELIDSYLGAGFDFELRLGEHTALPTDDPEAAERARQGVETARRALATYDALDGRIAAYRADGIRAGRPAATLRP